MDRKLNMVDPRAIGGTLRAETYHAWVRRLILIVMIVLLPLRAWAGDSMSISMAMPVAAQSGLDAMPADCPMHTSATLAEAVYAAVDHQGPGMQGCGSCDLCLSFTDLVFPPYIPGSAGKQNANDGVSLGYLNAEQTRNLRPPIR